MRKVWFLFALVLGLASPLPAEEATVTWSFKSAKANEAVRKYQAARKKLDDSYEGDRKENRAALVAKMQEEVKAATKANSLDEALAIRDAIKVLQTVPRKTAKLPASPTSPDDKTDRTARDPNVGILLGSWQVEITSPTKGTTRFVWTFNRDHSINLIGPGETSRGVWMLEKDYLSIRWPDRTGEWETFKLPLSPIQISGDSWVGNNSVRAIKIKD